MLTAASTPEQILQRLDWQVVRKLDGLLQGDYRSLFYGYGVDFANLREYQPEDDIRYMDWNVTARIERALRQTVYGRPRNHSLVFTGFESIHRFRHRAKPKAHDANRFRHDPGTPFNASREPGRRNFLRQPDREDHPGTRRA